MDNFKYAKYKAPQYVGEPIEEQVAAIKELDRRHLENQQLAADLEASVASLNLNEAESEYKARLLSDMQASINSAVEGGDYSKAGDTLRQTARRYARDQGLLGRVKYQQEFETAKNAVMNNNNLTVEDKQMWLEQNKYSYQDITDKTGNVVGGTRFENKQVAEAVDFNKVVSDSARLTAERSGRDSKGNEFKAKSQEDILNTAVSSIKNDAKAMSRINQEYAYQEQLYKEGKPSSIVDPSGIIMSKESYIKQKMYDGSKAASYNNHYLANQLDRDLKVMEFEEKVAARLAREKAAREAREARTPRGRASSGSSTKNDDPNLIGTYTAGYRAQAPETYYTASATKNRAIDNMSMIGRGYDIEPSKDVEVNYNNIKKAIESDPNISEGVRAEKLAELNTNRKLADDAQLLKDQIRKDLPADQKDIMDAQDALDSGDLNSLPDSNKYKKNLVKDFNDVFSNRSGDNLDKIGFTIPKSVTNKKSLIEKLNNALGTNLDVKTNTNGETVVIVTRDQGLSSYSGLQTLFSDQDIKNNMRHTEIVSEDGNNVTTEFTTKDPYLQRRIKHFSTTYEEAINKLEEKSDKLNVPIELTTTDQLSAAGIVDSKEVNDYFSKVINGSSWDSIPISRMKNSNQGSQLVPENDIDNKRYLKTLFNNATNLEYAIGDNPNEVFVTITNTEGEKEDKQSVKTTVALDLRGTVKNDPLINQVYNSPLMQVKRTINSFTNTNQAVLSLDLKVVNGEDTLVLRNNNGKYTIDTNGNEVLVNRQDLETIYRGSDMYNNLLIQAPTLSQEDFTEKAKAVTEAILIAYPNDKFKQDKQLQLINNLIDSYEQQFKK